MYDETNKRGALLKAKDNLKKPPPTNNEKKKKTPSSLSRPPPKKRHVKKQQQTPPPESETSSDSSSSSSESESESEVEETSREIQESSNNKELPPSQSKKKAPPKVHKKLEKPQLEQDTDNLTTATTIECTSHISNNKHVTLNNDDNSQDEATETTTNESATEDELLNKLIRFEHNYFETQRVPSPTPSTFVSSSQNDKSTQEGDQNILKEQTQQQNNNKNNILNSNNRNDNKLRRTDSEPTAEKRRRSESPDKGELKYKFQMRTKEQEERTIWDLYKNDLDEEDVVYLKQAFESLQQVAAKAVELYSWTDLTCIFSTIFLLSMYFVSGKNYVTLLIRV